VLLVVATTLALDADELLAALHSADPAPAVLDTLTSGGFSAMPGFALIEYRGQSAHYFVRGGVEIAFTGPGGERSASGEGITTWNEQLISGVDGFRAAASASASCVALPLGDGAVWGGIAEYSVDGSTAAGAPARPAGSSAEAALAPASVPASAPATAPAPTAAASPSPQPEPVLAPVRAASAAEDTILPPEIDEETIAGPLPAVAASAQTVPEDSIPIPDGTTGYDHLFGVTQMKSVEAAAVRPHEEEDEDEASASGAPGAAAASAPASESADLDDVGDHDGLTMMSGEISALRKRAAEKAAAQSAAAPAAPAAEPQFRIDFPDGSSEPLDRPVIVGRSPSANKVSGSELPRLVTIGGSDPDISRNHVRFTVEGGTVVITDLHSRNGTLMSLPGRPPQKLREGEPTSALAGTIVDLGGDIRITVVEVPAGS